MYRLMINNQYIMNVSSFSESIDASGELKLIFGEPVNEIEQISNIENLMISLKPFFEDNSVENVSIVNDEETILNTTYFSKINDAALMFNENIGHTVFNLVLI